MASVDPNFKASIFNYNQPLVIATNRNSAFIYGVRLRYQSGGYAAGTVLAENTTDLRYQAYNDSGSSGINTAKAILFQAYAAEDFDGTASTSSTLAVAIFGGCSVFKDNLTGYDANALTDLGGKLITLADSTVLLKF